MTTAELATIVAAAVSAGGLGAVLTYLIARRGTSGSVAVTTADRLWEERSEFSKLQREEIADLRQRLTLQDSRLMHYEQSERDCKNKLIVVEARLGAAETLLQSRRDSDTISAMARRVESVGAVVEVVAETAEKTLQEVKTANSLAAGEIVDASYEEQLRLKQESGVELSDVEQTHRDSMEIIREGGTPKKEEK